MWQYDSILHLLKGLKLFLKPVVYVLGVIWLSDILFTTRNVGLSEAILQLQPDHRQLDPL